MKNKEEVIIMLRAMIKDLTKACNEYDHFLVIDDLKDVIKFIDKNL